MGVTAYAMVSLLRSVSARFRRKLLNVSDVAFVTIVTGLGVPESMCECVPVCVCACACERVCYIYIYSVTFIFYIA